jgi:hypothetical protein
VGSLKRFLYRATGEAGDLLDNLRAEVDRLSALAELMADAGQAVAELLRDVADRMREILKREASAGIAPTEGGSGRRRR